MQWIASSGERFSAVRKDRGSRSLQPHTSLSVAARTYSATQFMTTPMLQATIDIHEHAALFFEAALARERDGQFSKADAMRRQGLALLDVLRGSVEPHSGALGSDLARIYDYLRTRLRGAPPTEIASTLETASQTLYALLEGWRKRRTAKPPESVAAP